MSQGQGWEIMEAADKPKTKQFTTRNVPGFEDGHPLTLRPKFCMSGGFHEKELELMGSRTTEAGIQLIALLPATPAVFDAHVRVKLADEPERNRF